MKTMGRIKYEAYAGQSIESAVRRAERILQRCGGPSLTLEFNGVEIDVDNNTTPEDNVRSYYQLIREKRITDDSMKEFKRWWLTVGSAMRPDPDQDQDHSEHAERVARTAVLAVSSRLMREAALRSELDLGVAK